MLELARAGGARTAPLADSGWRSRVTDRLSSVVDPDAASDLASALDRLDASPVTVPLGPWHGDWTAWNMSRGGTRVLLWDWEHFAEDVPVGFDLLHYLAQDLRVSAGTTDAAEREWRRRAISALSEHVGLTSEQQRAVLVAYLIEVNLRFVLDRQETVWSALRRDGWGLDLVKQEAEGLASG